MTLRHVAPAGAPVGVRDLLRWTGALAARGDGRDRLRAVVEARFGVERAYMTCTGRAGLTVLLRAMRRVSRPELDEVIVPAYTCYSVPASVVRAGLRPRLVDIDPATLDYDRAALETADAGRALAIVATNLYGTPNDLPYLTDYARRHELLVIDDAAQAMGAVSSGRPAGTWGDAGLYSLDKGKNVSAIDGGVLVTRSSKIAAALDEGTAALEEPGLIRRAEHIVKALLYASMLRPRLYWIPNAIPFLGLGKTVYTTEYAIEMADPSLAALGEVMFRQLDAFTAARRRNAAQISEEIGSRRGLSIPHVQAGSTSACLRVPLLVDDANLRQRLLLELNAVGIGAAISYPAALADVPDLQPALAGKPQRVPGARSVASRLVTLPTHPYVSPRDIESIGAVVKRVTAGGGATAVVGAVTP